MSQRIRTCLALLALLSTSCWIKSIDGCSSHSHHDHDHHSDTRDLQFLNTAVRIGDTVWPSRQAFGDEGGRCSTVDPSQEELALSESRLASSRAANPHKHRRLLDGPISIPVIVHIIKKPNGKGATEQMVANQMEVLQQAFAPDFNFTLMQTKTTVKKRFFKAGFRSDKERDMKDALHVGGPETLNIYFNNPDDGTLGWAAFPWLYEGNPSQDGIVVKYQTMPGGFAPPYNLGDTAVHEVGHWLGLYHTFQGGCDQESDDKVSDTPRQRGPTFGCPRNRDSCPSEGLDPVTNYMDYSDDDCMFQFTEEQRDRMVDSWFTFREMEAEKSETEAPTLAPTGAPTGAPTKCSGYKEFCTHNDHCCNGRCNRAKLRCKPDK